MKIKIHGWSTRQGDPLCPSCKHSFARKGTAQGEESMICDAMYEYPTKITFPVIECNRYRDANMPSLGDMTKIAWYISPDHAGKAGFVTKGNKATEAMRDEAYDNNPFD